MNISSTTQTLSSLSLAPVSAAYDSSDNFIFVKGIKNATNKK